MASIISAGTTSSTALNMSADTSGVLQLASNNGTVGLTLNTSQNIGIGVTPSAWSSGSYAIQNAGGSIWQFGGSNIYMGANYYFNGTNRIYVNTDYATEYQQGAGVHRWYNAPSGTAGNAVTMTERMRIDALGYLGINTNSPTTFLDVRGNSTINSSAFYASTFTSSISGTGTAGSIGALQLISYTTGTPTQCWASLHVVPTGGGYRSGLTTTYAADSAGGYCAWNAFSPGGGSTSEVGRFDYLGNFLIGQTALGGGLSTGGIYLRNAVAANGGSSVIVTHNSSVGNGNSYAEFWYNTSNNGSITQNSTTTVAYNTTSDYRLKENIQPMVGALEKVSQLKPVTYDWISNKSKGQGFIAHELQAVVPDCVTGEKDAINKDGTIKPQQIDTSFLIATLTSAIQELNAKITSLEEQVLNLGVK